MNKDFTITRLTWHTRQKGNEGREHIYRPRLLTLLDFLEQNSLLTPGLRARDLQHGDDVVLMRSHLTEEGFRVIQLGYDKWLAFLDRPGNAEKYRDQKHLLSALEKVRRSRPPAK